MKTLTSNLSKAGLLAALVIVTTSASVFSQAAASTNAPPFANSDEPAFKSDEVLVKFRGDVTDEQIASAFRGASLQLIKQIQTPVMRGNGDIGITRALTKMPVQAAVNVLKNLPGIEYAEPNWVYMHQAISSDDPLFTDGSLWGMYGESSSPANQYGSHAAEAWAAGYVGSQSVVVGVIDEGIQITHPDLAANIWVNPGEIPGTTGVDDDHNGYIDDINGWNFFGNNNLVYDPAGDAHGTHVAGTIGAVGGNGKGVAGVNWYVSIVSGKFLGPKGGTTADAIEAVDYFTDLKKNHGIPVVALNNSWGGGGYSQGLHDAIIKAAKADILFVAAAGNGNAFGIAVNNDRTPTYPACYNTAVGTSTEMAASYDSVIAVTAIDSSGNKASWANYGAKTVDLGAPGVAINSTLPTDSYGAYGGTSMATPHVTGAIALYASTHPDASAEDIRTAILDSVTPTLSLSGKTVTGGRLNLSSVITPPPAQTPPAAPSGLTATARTFSGIELTWTDNSDNESRFEIVRGTTVITVGANTTRYVDSGLDPLTLYTYTVRACNSAGQSADVGPVSAKTLKGPDPATATYAGMDTTTQGTWDGVYGTQGYHIYRYGNPSERTYISGWGTAVSVLGASPNTWSADGTTEIRALQTPDAASRFADCYYSPGTFIVDVDLPQLTRISMYFLDWDRKNRAQRVELVDGNYPSLVLDTQTLAGFTEGTYLAWDVKGKVRFQITRTGGDNAVLSGIFFDTAVDTEPKVKITSPANSANVPPTITLTASASDDVKVTQVEFLVDGFPVATDADGTDGWSATATLANGAAVLTAVATDSANQKTTSAAVNVTVGSTVPTKPSGLSARALSKNQIKLTWVENSDNETGFKIERSTNQTYWSQIGTVGANVTTFTSTGLARSTTYYYRVRAYNTAGNSDYSDTAVATTLSR